MTATANRQLVERFWQAMNTNDWEAVGHLLHDAYTLDWPQSGERIRGRDHFVAVNAHYPAAGPWRFVVQHIVADDDGAASDVLVFGCAGLRARGLRACGLLFRVA